MVSIVIPCRNEMSFIGKCLDSILSNDFPKDRLEVLVIDGMSQDGTRAIAKTYAQRHPFIKLLDNQKRVTPAALNVGISHAKGQIIMRMDAHATYDHEYISRCVKALEEHKVDNVGGIWRIVPRQDNLVAKAVARSLSHQFGIGSAHYRNTTSREPRLVDTVPYFCCPKEVFQRVGTFNEHLVRGQDMEFSLRLRNAGGHTLLVPDIISHYYARTDLKSFLKHNWTNGVWAILPFLYSPVMPVSWRHLVPLALVLALMGAAATALLNPLGLFAFALVAGAYGAATLTAAAQVAVQERDLRYLALMPLTFAGLHLPYGLGSLWGLARLVVTTQFWKKASRLGGQHRTSNSKPSSGG